MDKDIENAVLALFMLAVTSGNKTLARKLYDEQGHVLTDQWRHKAQVILKGFVAMDDLVEHLHKASDELKAELGIGPEAEAKQATDALLSKFKLH